LRILTAGRTLRISEEPQFIKLASESIISHHAANQRITDVQQEFDGLGRLEQSGLNRA